MTPSHCPMVTVPCRPANEHCHTVVLVLAFFTARARPSLRGPTHPQCSARPQKRRHALLLLLPFLFIRLRRTTSPIPQRAGSSETDSGEVWQLDWVLRPARLDCWKRKCDSPEIRSSENFQTIFPPSLPSLLQFPQRPRKGRKKGDGRRECEEGRNGCGRTRQDCRVVRTLQGDFRHSSEVA